MELNKDEKALLEHLPRDGSAVGNRTVQRTLRWNDSRYWVIRNSLVDKGLVLRGRGRGGSVRITEIENAMDTVIIPAVGIDSIPRPKIKIHPRRLGGLLAIAVSAAILAASAVAPVSVAAAEPCADAIFIGVRGSDDPADKNRGMGTKIEPVYERVQAGLPGRTIEAKGLDYPAVSVFKGFNSPRAGDYKDSVSDGARELDREVTSAASRCPVTPLVLAGHSQGAHLINRYLASENASLYRKNIVGIALLGDPTRVPSRAYNVAPNPAGAGAFFAPGWGHVRESSTPLPEFWGKIDSYCLQGDHVCAGGPREWLDTTGGKHSA